MMEFKQESASNLRLWAITRFSYSRIECLGDHVESSIIAAGTPGGVK